MNLQEEIYQNVEARGYAKRKDGQEWPRGYFVARQLVKALDEAIEAYQAWVLSSHTLSSFPEVANSLDEAVQDVRNLARRAFSDQDTEYMLTVERPSSITAGVLLKELADVVIPCLCAAEQLRRDYPGLPTLEEAIREKALADVQRGVSQ